MSCSPQSQLLSGLTILMADGNEKFLSSQILLSCKPFHKADAGVDHSPRLFKPADPGIEISHWRCNILQHCRLAPAGRSISVLMLQCHAGGSRAGALPFSHSAASACDHTFLQRRCACHLKASPSVSQQEGQLCQGRPSSMCSASDYMHVLISVSNL